MNASPVWTISLALFFTNVSRVASAAPPMRSVPRQTIVSSAKPSDSRLLMPPLLSIE